MVNKNKNIDPQLVVVEQDAGFAVALTLKEKLSLYNKSQKSGVSTDILEEVYRRGYHAYYEELAIDSEMLTRSPEQYAFERVNSFIAGGMASQIDEDLKEKRGLWDNIHAKRERIKHGSGEHMRKPGSKGAPTAAALKASQTEDVVDEMKMGNPNKLTPSVRKDWRENLRLHHAKKKAAGKPQMTKDQLRQMAADAVKNTINMNKEENIDEISSELVGKVNKARAIGGKPSKTTAASKTLSNAVNKAFVNSKVGVTKEEVSNGETISNNSNDPSSRFVGSDSLTQVYKDMTPGQSKLTTAVKKVVRESQVCEDCNCGLREELINERGADSKGYYRSTESGAGLTAKGAKHFGIKTAVTTPPSKLKAGSKAAKRRKSFCARMGGMKGPMKDEKGRPTRKAMSLRRWNCHS